MRFTAFAVSLAAAFLMTAAAMAQDVMPVGDADAGARVFNRCKACHTLADGAPSRVGPNLWNFFGQPAGSRDDFRFSPAMKQAGANGLIWTPETLDAYLENPRTNMPGNRMTFVGLRKPQERADVIAYLQRETIPAAP